MDFSVLHTQGWVKRLSAIALKPPGASKWTIAALIFAAAFVVRWLFGATINSISFAPFAPTIIVITLICGWQPALTCLIGAIICIWYFLTVPHGSFALIWPSPLILGLVAFTGAFEIFIVEGFTRMLVINARQQQKLNDLIQQQDTMFREMQHRVSNNMQFIVTMLTLAKRQLGRGVDSDEVFTNAIMRITSMAHLHRKLHDIASYNRGLQPMLQDILTELLAGLDVEIRMSVAPVSISLDQMSAAVLIVVEAVTNSIKYVYQPGLGTTLDVHLRELPGNRLVLMIRDDGPGNTASFNTVKSRPRLGLRIMQGLTIQLRGKLTVKSLRGMIIRVEFPKAQDVFIYDPDTQDEKLHKAA